MNRFRCYEMGSKFCAYLSVSAKIANFTAREKRLYKSDMLDEQSIAMHERFVDKKARESQSLEIARNLLAKGIPEDTIIECTGVSADDLNSMK